MQLKKNWSLGIFFTWSVKKIISETKLQQFFLRQLIKSSSSSQGFKPIEPKNPISYWRSEPLEGKKISVRVKVKLQLQVCLHFFQIVWIFLLRILEMFQICQACLSQSTQFVHKFVQTTRMETFDWRGCWKWFRCHGVGMTSARSWGPKWWSSL